LVPTVKVKLAILYHGTNFSWIEKPLHSCNGLNPQTGQASRAGPARF
jgi:hypothetical protein